MAGHREIVKEDLSEGAASETNVRTLRNYATNPGSGKNK
jgi:hypothetical protein